MRKIFQKSIVAAVLAATSIMPFAAYAKYHHHFVSVEVMRETMATMKDGAKLHVQVIKMNGHMMAAIPMADLPEYLRQQIFVPGDQ